MEYLFPSNLHWLPFAMREKGLGMRVSLSASFSRDPIENHEAAHDIWEHVVEQIAHGMRAAVDSEKYLDAKRQHKKRYDYTLPGHRAINPTPGFEPLHRHDVSS
jgi:hypothetical protein